MGLSARMPAVCAALDARMFADNVALRIAQRDGPRQGANAVWVCRLGAPSSAPTTPATPVGRDNVPSPVPRGLATCHANYSSPARQANGDADLLEGRRRRIIARIRQLEGSEGRTDSLGDRVRCQMEAGRITELTAKLIFAFLWLRNRVVYDGRGLRATDRTQSDALWRGIEAGLQTD
jgi:hypothetical protein